MNVVLKGQMFIQIDIWQFIWQLPLLLMVSIDPFIILLLSLYLLLFIFITD